LTCRLPTCCGFYCVLCQRLFIEKRMYCILVYILGRITDFNKILASIAEGMLILYMHENSVCYVMLC